MRAVLFLLTGLLALSAPPPSAAGTVAVEAAADPGPRVENHEETLDALLDGTGAADEHLGDTGRCVRQSAVGAAKDLYGDHDGKGDPLDCLLSQCVGWPPNVYVNDENCIEMVKDLLGLGRVRTDPAGP